MMILDTTLASGPRAFRKTEIWKVKLASSTKVSGHNALINSCLVKTRPLLSTRRMRRSNVFTPCT